MVGLPRTGIDYSPSSRLIRGDIALDKRLVQLTADLMYTLRILRADGSSCFNEGIAQNLTPVARTAPRGVIDVVIDAGGGTVGSDQKMIDAIIEAINIAAV